MSKTPRTDEHLLMKEENGHVVIVSRDFARQLETELADKNKQLAEARAEIDELNAEIERLKSNHIDVGPAIVDRALVPENMELKKTPF